MPERMRILVSLTDAHSELRDELGRLPVRRRAERLRHLATAGLLELRSPAVSPERHIDTRTALGAAGADGTDPTEKRRARLLERLRAK